MSGRLRGWSQIARDDEWARDHRGLGDVEDMEHGIVRDVRDVRHYKSNQPGQLASKQ